MEKLLWIDMEMTGLDVQKERIIEVAAIVTDMNFNILDSYESIVYQEQSFIDNMDEWNTNQHKKSGLTSKISTAPKQDQVELDLCTMVNKHFPNKKEKPILAGNSIGQDRKFIDTYMKNLSLLLHYRMLDVSSWKIIMERKFALKYSKKDNHRALDDIKESIEELKTYITAVKP